MFKFINKIRLRVRFPDCDIRDSRVSRAVHLGSKVKLREVVLAGDNITVGEYTSIAEGSIILSRFSSIRIGKRTAIGPRCFIQNYSHNQKFPYLNNEYIRETGGSQLLADLQRETALAIDIGDDAWLGVNVVVLPGVKISDNVIIGANSVVTRSVPPNEIWGGVPARFIKRRSLGA